jgi:hypothetical protein
METRNVNLVFDQEKLLELLRENRGKEITEELVVEVIKEAGTVMTDEEIVEVAENTVIQDL